MTDVHLNAARPAARRPRSTTAARCALVLAFLGYLVLFAVLLHQPARYAPLVLEAVAIPVLATVVVLLVRAGLSTTACAGAIVGGGVGLQAAALSTGPTTSDDVYRYIWDGKVQLHGIDPYAYVPQSEHLVQLRDGLLFGPTSTCAHAIPGGCTAINRPDVHTVYPPTAQAMFDVIRVAALGHGGVRPFQIAAALGVLAITVLLLRVLQQRGRALWPVALWAWSPLVVVEYGNNAHIDWAAVLLSLCCLSAGALGRSRLTGVLLAAATLVKLYPILLLPAVSRRRPAVVIGVAAAVGLLAYLPHVLAVGSEVVGYLPGYLHEEGYDSGSRSLLLGLVLPHPADTVVGVLALCAVGVWCWRHTVADAPEHAATIFVGAAFLIATPAYGWYAGLLLALVVVSARYEWLPVVCAPTVAYLISSEVTHASWPGSIVYLVAAASTLQLARTRSRTHAVELAHV